MRAEVRTLRSQLSERLTQEEFVADSPAMEQVKELVARVAPTDSNVVIEGETGTGKEKVAATIHRLSRRDIDVVFSDLRMAGLDGPSLFHEATRRDPKWKDQFVFMTGDMLSSEMREVLESTNAPRLAKPFGIMDVRRVFAQIQRRPHERG